MEKSDEETNSDTDAELPLHKMTATLHNPPRVSTMKSKTDSMSSVIKVQPKIEGLPIEMEVHTGTAVSIISKELYSDKLSHIQLWSTNAVLKTYTGKVILPEGVIKVHVKLNRQSVRLPLYVVTGKAAPLLEREWL